MLCIGKMQFIARGKHIIFYINVEELLKELNCFNYTI